MPIRATPTVPTVPQLDPVAKLTAAHRMHAAGRKMSLLRTSNPKSMRVGIMPDTNQVPANAPMSSRIRTAPMASPRVSLMRASKVSQPMPRVMPKATVTPEAMRRATWLLP